MQMTSSLIKTTLSATLFTALLTSALQVQAGPHEPAQTPLFASQSAPPLNMLVLGRDHTLYSPAYDNASDLDGDGVIDVGYKGYLSKDQGGLDYFGYFDSYKCYNYSSGVFTPLRATEDKTCSGNNWSGDYLNYLTTSRMDALRKVLYGGYRSTDTAARGNSASKTILERVYIRQDAHTWGSEYTSQAVDGYNIKDYTEFDAPGNNRRILFANTNTSRTGAPQLRVRKNSSNRIWDWVAAEVTQAANPSDHDFNVRVEVCKEPTEQNPLEDNCTQYEGRNYKPTGLLHDFGESDDMYFGLLTGSYTNNLQGGVLRKALSSFRDEIDVKTGIFNSDTPGIVETLDRLKIDDANNSGSYQDCTTGNTLSNGSCRNWGNPLGEMMFETLRYLSGASGATSNYSYAGNNDKGLALPKASWGDPYAAGGLGSQCSRPFMTVISDVNPSYDSSLPGNSFGETAPATTSALSGLNVSSLGQVIWNTDVGAGSKQINIGQIGTVASDYAPTAKTASSLGNIRGLPDEPTKQGTYYSASVAYYANTHPLTSQGQQPVKTYAVALSSPLPQIRMPVGDGEITLVPFGKVVTGNPDVTMQITGFFVDSMANMPGQPTDNTNGGRPQAIFRVVFDDAAQGADYDMDAVVEYKVSVTADNQLEVILQRLYANAGHESHMGYTLAGAGDADGIYLEVTGGRNNGYTKYKFDTPRGRIPGACNPTSKSTCSPALITRDNTPTAPRYFSPGSGSTTPLENPLWYAAKWGGFGGFDNTSSSKPVDGQWDSKNPGTPDNYFLVTNAANLQAQLTAAFRSLADSVGSVTSPAVRPDGNTAEDSEFSVYRTDYQVSNWSGNLIKEHVDAATGQREILWDAASELTAGRNIMLANADGDGLIDFNWNGLDNRYHGNIHLQAALASDAEGNPAPLQANGTLNSTDSSLGKSRLSEARSRKLRDIINSSPVIVEGAQYLHYLANRIEPDSDYGAFASTILNRKPLVYIGSNGGMLHAFDALNGAEHFAFVPTAAIPNLYRLSSPDYNQAGGEHHYFVDGTPVVRDVYFNGSWRTVLIGTLRAGGRSLFALDITNADNIELLWEFNVGDDLHENEEGASDLGYSFPTPTIARLHSGQWAVITGNGYDSEGRRAALLLIDIETGDLIRKLPVGTSPDFSNDNDINGLSSVRVADNNSDGIADYVYAGDLQGNLWRFELINTNDPTPLKPSGAVVPDHFTVSFGGNPLYSATNTSGERQPITAPPSLVRHPSMEGYIVMFGTGRYFQTTDKDTNRLDSLYGIWDKQTAGEPAATTPNLARNNLVAQSFTDEKQLTFHNDGSTTTATVRMLSDNQIDWSSEYGWVLNLAEDNGERIIDEMSARGQVLLLTSRTPVDSDPCAPGLMGWTYGINPYSGGRTAFNVFDFNQSGNVGVDDSDNGNVVSGFQTPAGGLTLSGDTLFGTDGSTTKVDYGAISTGRQSWQVIPEGE